MSLSLPKTYPFSEIVAHARSHCPFYQRLYAGLGENPALADLPIVDPEDLWKAHDRDRREVLTSPFPGALVVNSGGTTGAPKNSYFTAEEWISTALLSAKAFAGSGVQKGDRVANLYSAGDLHSSFLLVAESLRTAFPDALQLPLSSSLPAEYVIKTLRAFNANVLAGFPTHLLRLIERIDQAGIEDIHIERILFAGEMLSRDQHTFLESRFPGISIHSIGYASVDAGLVGYADAACGLGEHRVFDGATIVELINEDTGLPVEEVNTPGRVVFTSLVRRLMPVIRYPVGDVAQWIEPPGTPSRRFVLLGRSQESARVTSSNVSVTEMRALLAPFMEPLSITEFQLLVTREKMLDRLTVRIVAGAPPEALAAARPRILQKIKDENFELAELLAAGVIHPFEVEWITRNDLVVSQRTGKLLMVVDRRAG